MRVAVIGGGLGGLTAARALVAAGIDAHVLEDGARAGGVVGTSSMDGFIREHAASSFLGGPPRGALATCRELGVEVEHASPRAKRRWIYIDGKLRALPGSPVDLVRSDLLTWRGKLDLLREPFKAANRAITRGGHDESMHAFAARRLGPEAARAIVDPFVTGIFAASAHDISLEAGFPKLAALEAQGGLVRGMAKQAGRQLFGTVLQRIAGKPAKPKERGLWAPKGGLGKLVEALVKSLGDRLHLASPVERIEPADQGVLVDGERWDAVVLAVPAAEASSLVAVPELATRLSSFHRAPAALAYVGFPEEAVANRDGFGVLVAQGEAVRVLGVVFESVVWSGRAPAGHVLLRCIYGGSRDPSAIELDDGALLAQVRADLSTVLGITAEPSHTSIVRWPRGIAQYPVGHREVVRAAVTAARTHRIVLAGADYRGPGINDLCADADLVVDEIRAWGGS